MRKLSGKFHFLLRFCTSNWRHMQVQLSEKKRLCSLVFVILMGLVMLGDFIRAFHVLTRMHSSRMHTAHSFTVCHTRPPHACNPSLPRMSPTIHTLCHTSSLPHILPATHAPYLPRMPPTTHSTLPCHAHPVPCIPHAMHAPCHACPPATHTPCTACPYTMQTPCHAHPLPVDRILSWHTLLKMLPCHNFVAGGNKIYHVGIIVNYVFRYIWSFVLYLYQMMFVNVKLDVGNRGLYFKVSDITNLVSF